MLEDKNILRVGLMMRYKSAYTETIRAMSYMARHFSVELFFFTPDDIDFDNKTVKAVRLDGDNKSEEVIPLPVIIDNDPDALVGKRGKKIRRLAKGCFFVHPLNRLAKGAIVSKQKINELLAQSEQFKEFVIETNRIKTFEEILPAIEKYPNGIVLKPLWGSHGKGVTKIKAEGGQYVAHLQNQNFSLETVDDLAKFYAEHCTKYIQILQPYIASRTQQGNPFDIRLHARRGAGGKFNLFPYPRIGNLDAIVSNINAGGYTMPIKTFLQTEFGGDWKMLYDKLIQIGSTLPEYCQSLLRNNLYNVGIDVGIQRTDNGYELKIFEINMRYLGSRCLPIDAAITSLEYYRYVYDELREDESK